MNKLRQAIEELEEKECRSELEDILLNLLYEKEEELGDTPTDEAAGQAVIQAKQELRQYILGKRAREDGRSADVENAASVIRRLLESKDIPFRECALPSKMTAFQLDLKAGAQGLKVMICLKETPKLCRVDAIYPFRAAAEYVYPLCLHLARESYHRHYGGLYYDAQDGELSYRYSFPLIPDGFEADFLNALKAVVLSALECYAGLKRYADGKFHLTERQEAVCNAQQLILALDR